MAKDTRPPRDPVSHRRYRSKRTTRSTGKRAKNEITAAARRAVLTHEILQLRIQGLSNRAIAEELIRVGKVAKITHVKVNELLMEALDQINMPEADRLKRMELERLDNIINGHYKNATEGDVGATHAVLACIDRRNRLLGIGQETKVTSQTLGADGKPIDPVRPIINLTITQATEPALPAPTIDVPVAKRLN